MYKSHRPLPVCPGPATECPCQSNPGKTESKMEIEIMDLVEPFYKPDTPSGAGKAASAHFSALRWRCSSRTWQWMDCGSSSNLNYFVSDSIQRLRIEYRIYLSQDHLAVSGSRCSLFMRISSSLFWYISLAYNFLSVNTKVWWRLSIHLLLTFFGSDLLNEGHGHPS